MSLATRCFTCGTVFRVVQDQLKVSEGWVRCGRCNEVFNALESLFDLERDTPPEWAPPGMTADDMPSRLGSPVDLELPTNIETEEAQARAEASSHEHVSFDEPARHHVPFESPDHIDVPLAALLHEPAVDSSADPTEHVEARDPLDFSDARFDSESSAPHESMLPVHDTTIVPLADSDVAPLAPEFVLHAQRRARWNGPVARIGLSLAGLVLIVALVLQVGHQFRDTIAARWAETQPVLSAWCDAVGCTILPPRHIDDVAVESTALTRADGADAFKLAVTLRNRGALALALPSIDLSLTDAGGQLVARRMLAPKEWRLATTTLPAGAELPLQLLLAADSGRITGYTVEVFYP